MNDSDHNPTLDPALLARLLEAGEPVPPPEEARARMRADILRRSRVHAPVPNASGLGMSGDSANAVPDALVSVRPDDVAPWQDIMPGLAKQVLLQVGECETFLLRIDPGTVVPAHSHALDEECVVIEGEITIAGVNLPQGSFHLAPAGVPHGDIVSPHGALLFIKSGHFRPGVPAHG